MSQPARKPQLKNITAIHNLNISYYGTGVPNMLRYCILAITMKKPKIIKAQLKRANEVLAEFGNIQQGARIIDAGCGLGHTTLWLAEY